jgi:phosphoribosylamine--glycine ligase/phosphoribosylformylglycinamidine cyclo-ligase
MSTILIVGSGGREHALAWKLAQSPTVRQIYVAPGNGGTHQMGPAVQNVPLDGSPANFEALQQFALDRGVDLVVPGPEQPLVDGIAAVFKRIGVPVFGPLALAARMEGSKAFSKNFMARHNIPTARFANFTDVAQAKRHIIDADYPLVLKADGIAAGKGVLIPASKQEALAGLDEIMVSRAFGSAGDEIVIEEFLEGDELLILTLCDGYSTFNLPAAQDHKRIGDGDQGLNTGGMGAYAPAPIATPALLAKINERIIEPTVAAMRRDGFPMCGVLFTGIMVTPLGEPKVLEYNVRFGDPETQTVLPLLSPETDLAAVMLACAEGRLDLQHVAVTPDAFAATVVMSAGGYPELYAKGDEVTVTPVAGTHVFHAGTEVKDGRCVTSGGRVIAATAAAPTLEEAVARAYAGVDGVEFKGKYNRRDIAHRAIGAAGRSDGSDSGAATSAGAGVTYADAGVSVDNGNLLVETIKAKVKLTARPGADSDIGGFGGLFDLARGGYSDLSDTLLVAATDGVGTKLRVAQIMDMHTTVGIDLVAMNVNDLVVQGAEPLIFLDYFATGKLDIKVCADFVGGVADGCIEAGCALVGGETLEMPGMYEGNHYDTNGTAVGAVLKQRILPRTAAMRAGDVLIGLASNGVHSNGFLLVRHIIDKGAFDYRLPAPWTPSGRTIGEELLVPTKIYVKQLLGLIRQNLLLGLAHITGGGLVENIPRALPPHLQAQVDMGRWEVPPIFKWFGRQGNVPHEDILKTFNMGVGMVLIVQEQNAAAVLANLAAAGERAFVIGALAERPEGAAGCVVTNVGGLY